MTTVCIRLYSKSYKLSDTCSIQISSPFFNGDFFSIEAYECSESKAKSCCRHCIISKCK